MLLIYPPGLYWITLAWLVVGSKGSRALILIQWRCAVIPFGPKAPAGHIGAYKGGFVLPRSSVRFRTILVRAVLGTVPARSEIRTRRTVRPPLSVCSAYISHGPPTSGPHFALVVVRKPSPLPGPAAHCSVVLCGGLVRERGAAGNTKIAAVRPPH